MQLEVLSSVDREVDGQDGENGRVTCGDFINQCGERDKGYNNLEMHGSSSEVDADPFLMVS